jgi:hypothetical protein
MSNEDNTMHKYFFISDGVETVRAKKVLDVRGYAAFVYRDINGIIYRTADWKVVSKIEGQLGCGYCKLEKTCGKHNPKINKAKLGCTEYKPFK